MSTKPPFATIGDEPIEARIVAWVLGDASAFEATELERLCDERPELLVFRRRMRALHSLLIEAETAEPDHSIKLPPEKRKALDEIFGTVEPANVLEHPRAARNRRYSWRQGLLAIAACLILLVGLASVFSAGSISVFSARKLAAVATAERQAASTQDSEAAVQELRKVVRAQEDSVEERRKTLVAIARSKGIISSGSDSSYRNTAMADDNGAKSAMDTSDQLETEKIQLESMMQSLQKYDSDQLMVYASGLQLPDNVVQSLYPKYLTEKTKLEQLKRAGLAEQHPALKAQQQVAESMKKQLDEGVNSLRDTLKSKLDLADARFNRALATKNDPRNDAIKRGTDAQDYVDAKREFEAEQATLQQLKMKLVDKEIAAKVREQNLAMNGDVNQSRSVSGKPGSGNLVPLVPDYPPELIEGTPGPPIVLNRATPAPTAKPASVALADRGKATKLEQAEKESRLSSDLAANNKRPVAAAAPMEPANSDGLNEEDERSFVGGQNGAASGKPRLLPPVAHAKRVAAEGTRSPYEMPDQADHFGSMPPLASLGDVGRLGGAGAVHGIGSGGAGKGKDLRPASESSNSVDLGDAGTNQEEAAGRMPEPRGPGILPGASFQTSQSAKSTRLLESSSAATADAAPPPVLGARQHTVLPTGIAGAPGGQDAAERPASVAVAGLPSAAATRAPAAPSAPAKIALSAKKSGILPVREDSDSDLSTDDLLDRKPAAHDGQDAYAPAKPPVLPALPAAGPAQGGKGDKLQKDTSGARSGLGHVSGSTTAPFPSTPSPAAPASHEPATQNAEVAKAPDGKDVALTGEIAYNDGSIATNGTLRSDERLLSEKSAADGTPVRFLDLVQKDKNPQSLALVDSDRYLVEARDAYAKNNYQQAYDNYAKGLALLPDAPASKDRREYLRKSLGEVAVALANDAIKDGMNGQAKGWLSKAVEWDPNNELARQKVVADVASEVTATDAPYTTFSLSISDASFKMTRAALARGERPDPSSIKVEQFYNAVDYGDPVPGPTEAVAGWVEQAAHPVIPGRNLVRVAVRIGAAGRSASQPLRLTLLVDQSGSMARDDRRAAMALALKQLAGLLTKNDLVTVIGFSRTPRLLADALAGNQASKLNEMVNQAASEGGTNLEEAMKLGEQLALRHQTAGAQNRIVLFTDGAANLGDADPSRLADKVTEMRQKGLAFDIAGIGTTNLNDQLLAELARHGNGRYCVVGAETDAGSSFARQLAGAFRPAAENVKVQVRFNPQRVGRYKLLGFEEHRLKTEDFRNDAVDAAELAAEEAGVALYQVEPLAEGSGELGEASLRFRDATSGQMVERTWTIPYEVGAAAFDRATPSLQLAGLAMLAAEKLRGGPLADAIDFKQLAASRATVKQFYSNSRRVAEMLEMINKL